MLLVLKTREGVFSRHCPCERMSGARLVGLWVSRAGSLFAACGVVAAGSGSAGRREYEAYAARASSSRPSLFTDAPVAPGSDLSSLNLLTASAPWRCASSASSGSSP
jgi:hypothetical protein